MSVSAEGLAKLREIRARKKVVLHPCSVLSGSIKDYMGNVSPVQLREYQKVGVLNLVYMKRFVLGDDTGLGKTIETLTTFGYMRDKYPELKLLWVGPKSSLPEKEDEVRTLLKGITARRISSDSFGRPRGEWEWTGTNVVRATDTSEVAPGDRLRPVLFSTTFEVIGVTPDTSVLLAEKEGKPFPTGRGALREGRNGQYKIFAMCNEDALLVNYDLLKRDLESILGVLGPRFMVVFDECTAFKSVNTETWEAAKKVADASWRTYGLTATVVKNSLREAYGIFKVIAPDLTREERLVSVPQGKKAPPKMMTLRPFMYWSHFEKAFCKTFRIRLKSGRFIPPKIVGYRNLDLFRSMIEPYFLGRTPQQVEEELPELIIKDIELELEGAQLDTYRSCLIGELQRLTESGRVKTVQRKVEILMNSLLISDSPAMIPGHESLGSTPSSKEKEFLRLLEDELDGEKIVFFTHFKKWVARLQKLLVGMKVRDTEGNEGALLSVRITGDESANERQEAVRRFSTENRVRVLFITKAGTEALNLQAARVLIMGELPWSYGDFKQLVGRIRRIGSRHASLMVLSLINKGTVDEYVLKVLRKKRDLFIRLFSDSIESFDFSEDDLGEIVNHVVSDVKGESSCNSESVSSRESGTTSPSPTAQTVPAPGR